jgi:Spy/CpxP family protein refolding chaperone
MRIKYLHWILAAIFFVAGVAVLAHSQTMGRPGMRHRGWGGRRGMFMARYLDLTDAQKTQIKSLWQQERTTIQPLMQQLAAGRKQMLAATAKGNFDQAKVQSIATQQAQTLAQLMVARQQLQTKIYNTVLTPEQRAKVDQIREKQLSRLDQQRQGSTTTK